MSNAWPLSAAACCASACTSSAVPTASAYSAPSLDRTGAASMPRRQRGLAVRREHEQPHVQQRARRRRRARSRSTLSPIAWSTRRQQRELRALRLAALQLLDHRLGVVAPTRAGARGSARAWPPAARETPTARSRSARPVRVVAQRQLGELRQLRPQVGQCRGQHARRRAPRARPRRWSPAPRAPASRRRARRGSRTSGRVAGGSCGQRQARGTRRGAASSPRRRSSRAPTARGRRTPPRGRASRGGRARRAAPAARAAAASRRQQRGAERRACASSSADELVEQRPAGHGRRQPPPPLGAPRAQQPTARRRRPPPAAARRPRSPRRASSARSSCGGPVADPGQRRRRRAARCCSSGRSVETAHQRWRAATRRHPRGDLRHQAAPVASRSTRSIASALASVPMPTSHAASGDARTVVSASASRAGARCAARARRRALAVAGRQACLRVLEAAGVLHAAPREQFAHERRHRAVEVGDLAGRERVRARERLGLRVERGDLGGDRGLEPGADRRDARRRALRNRLARARAASACAAACCSASSTASRAATSASSTRAIAASTARSAGRAFFVRDTRDTVNPRVLSRPVVGTPSRARRSAILLRRQRGAR